MFTISSTWDAIAPDGSTTSLPQCLRTIKDSQDFKFDSETMIDVGSCVQLVKPSKSSGNKCNISVSPKDISSSASRLLIISESRRVEVLSGLSGEYKFTSSGKLLDDSDPEMVMFMIDITLEKPCHEPLKLNLTGIEEKCWLLAVFVFVSGDEIKRSSNFPEIPGVTTQSRFDLEEMNALLKSTELSDNAQSFKTLFETFQSTASFPTLGSTMMTSFPTLSSTMVKPVVIPDLDKQICDNKNVQSLNAASSKGDGQLIKNNTECPFSFLTSGIIILHSTTNAIQGLSLC